MKFGLGKYLSVLFAIFVTVSAIVEPIWLSPTNVDVSIPGGNDFSNIAESFVAEKGVWANITVGAGSRSLGPGMAVDSKGILWIMFGSRYDYSVGAAVRLYTVWNYDPKTDLYRYVWGDPSYATTDSREPGELGVESVNNHPGYILYTHLALDNNDNIWFTSYEYTGELWMFNTTSMMFVRVHGLDPATDVPSIGANPGQPGEDVWPGYQEGQCLVVDSQNDIWSLAGYNRNGYQNSVWHFNTTSKLWTYIYGDIKSGVVGNETYFGGTYLSACFIDENDKVWLFGGYGQLSFDYFDSAVMWTFDTRGNRRYEIEYMPPGPFAPETMSAVSTSDDYNADNHPGGCESCSLVDRLDGTLMLFSAGAMSSTGEFGPSNQVWQYSKSLKQWRLVYGNISSIDQLGVYSDYRTPGSTMPGLAYGGQMPGKIMNGDLYIVAGTGYSNTNDDVPGRKDIWLIPNDQCASPTANKCDKNADCIEEMIGYSCACKQGYTGDGFTCDAVPVAPLAEVPVAAPVAQVTPVAGTPQTRSNSAVVVEASVMMVTLYLFAL